jgi:murein DD-endopeptidase MepM/ murein hydrolase activator NlpD
MKKRYFIIVIILVVGVVLSSRFVLSEAKDNPEPQELVQQEPQDREVVINIESGMTFSVIAEEAGLSGTLMHELLEITEEVYDLATIKVGKPMKFYFDPYTDELKEIVYQINSEEELFVTKDAENLWQAERLDIPYQVKIKTVSGSIDSSLYESALEQNIDIRAIIDLAEIFAWTIDFGMGIRQGDTYKFIFEERYRNGEYIMPGRIIAARFVNNGQEIEGYYFNEGLDEDGFELDGYYHADGTSVQKIFLKNPVSYKYISSGYTTGRRYISAFDISTGHRAIDYSAKSGSPIRAVGDGTITFAGWNSQGYGNLVKMRHNSTFSTNYAHMSKIYVSPGQRVQQGDIIGAVGSTGLSTGPHLHFEMVKFGTKINPLTVDLPSDKAVKEENLESFQEIIKNIQQQLK